MLVPCGGQLHVHCGELLFLGAKPSLGLFQLSPAGIECLTGALGTHHKLAGWLFSFLPLPQRWRSNWITMPDPTPSLLMVWKLGFSLGALEEPKVGQVLAHTAHGCASSYGSQLLLPSGGAGTCWSGLSRHTPNGHNGHPTTLFWFPNWDSSITALGAKAC